jgi:hypothetical protein
VAGDATVTQNNVTATLADFDYSYDKWLAYNFAPLWPAASGCYSENDGIGNTRKIVTEFVANHGKSLSDDNYAAGYCYNYSVNAPGLGKHHWFLGVAKDMGEVRPVSHTLQTAAAWGTGAFWSCSQHSAAYAWRTPVNGSIDYNTKYREFSAIPLADLILEN